MKALKQFFALIMAVAFLAFAESCGSDDSSEPAGDPLAGTYVISSAILAAPVTAGSTVLLPSGTDITAPIGASFLLEANCSNIANARIELKENNQIWYVCLTEGAEFQNGTWTINTARDELNINLTIQGQTFPLRLTNFNESTLSGLVNNLPLTPDLLLAVDPTLEGLNEQFYLSTVNLTLSKD